MQTICVAFFQIGGNFLTNAIFPENPFWFFLECNGEFDEYKDLNGATPWIKNDTKSDDSDEYGIGDYFFHNCWSMTSTIDFGLHDITKILKEPRGSLTCGIPLHEKEKSYKYSRYQNQI